MQKCGGSPLTLPPNFKCEKGSVTAAAAACHPAGGFLLVEKGYFPCNFRVILESHSTGEMRTLFFFCFFFSFQQRKKEA